MLYGYTQENLQSLLDYLAKRPYHEVYELIDMLRGSGKPIDDTMIKDTEATE